MLIKMILKTLLSFSSKEKNKFNKIIETISVWLFFLLLLPAPFVLVFNKYFLNSLYIKYSFLTHIFIVCLFIFLGLFIIIWSIISHLKIGKGTSVPNIPPKNLIILGPYKIVRNPIMLGLAIYYCGIGTLFANLSLGIMSFILYLLAGGFYNKFVEEKELEARFGDDYIEYKKNTPFVFPFRLFK
ncbi:methyltransferase family protein [Elusimicrobiota bacterium]